MALSKLAVLVQSVVMVGAKTTDKGESFTVRTASHDAGERLDRLLAGGVPELSRSRIKSLILAGQVGLGGATITDPSYRVKPGESFVISVPQPVPAEPRGQDIALTVVHEDDALIVIDKAAGMVVHPAPGNPDQTLVNALIHHCGASLSGIGGVMRPGIVHRLDKETSGLMVAAKTDAAHHSLSGQFATRTLSRVYLALVRGLPNPRHGVIRGNIGRSPSNRKKMAVLDEKRAGGRAAVTHYRVLQTFEGPTSLLECRLETGRTHQIRVHLTHRGHPLIGDKLYGGARTPPFARQALHAYKLAFDHPDGGARMSFEIALPEDMRALIDGLTER